MTIRTKNTIKPNKNSLLKGDIGNVIFAVILTLVCGNAAAIETNLSIHKGNESDTAGFSVAIADRFTKNSHFYWSLGYSSLKDIKVRWNNDDLFFDNDTIDALVSYRQKLNGYSRFLKKVTIEYQIGASIGLTDNKFFWTELNEEKYFSESTDVNPVIAISTHYNFTKKAAIILGLKHQPKPSEFDAISSVFLGFNYTFGKVSNY